MNKEMKFNLEKQNKIKEMINNKQFKYAIQAALSYLEKYPTDPLVKNLLGITYLVEGKLDIADACFTSCLGTTDARYAKYFLIKIAIERGEYELAYTYCCEILESTTDKLSIKDIQRTMNYIKTIMGINADKVYANNNYIDNYMYKQLEEYNYEETYKHILKHQLETNNDDNKATFNQDIDLRELLMKTSEKIQYMEEKHYPIRLASNCYYFYYSNIGKSNNEVANYFRVITFPNSKNIITMYPILDEEVYDIKNAVHFLEETQDFTYDENIKARTGIERFNTRYKRK